MAASPPDGAMQFSARLGSAAPLTQNREYAFSVWRNARGPTSNARRAGSMRRTLKRLILYTAAGLVIVALACGGLIVWPKPLFAFSLGAGRIVVSSDRPIPAAGGERVLRDCERLLERS